MHLKCMSYFFSNTTEIWLSKVIIYWFSFKIFFSLQLTVKSFFLIITHFWQGYKKRNFLILPKKKKVLLSYQTPTEMKNPAWRTPLAVVRYLFARSPLTCSMFVVASQQQRSSDPQVGFWSTLIICTHLWVHVQAHRSVSACRPARTSVRSDTD